MGGFFVGATETSPTFVMVASPQMTSTLFFLSRKPTPPFNCCDTPRERLTTAAGSALTLPSIFSP